MKAISIWQPWVWAILHAGKRLENRGWQAQYRGPILLHASKRFVDREVFETMKEDILPLAGPRHLLPKVTMGMLRASCGHMVGRAFVVDWISPIDEIPAGQEPWYMGSYALVLDDVRPLVRPIAVPGQLGLFDVPDHLLSPADLDFSK